MSNYDKQKWVDKIIASTVILLPAVIAVMPTPKVNLWGPALAALLLLVLVGMRERRIVGAVVTACRFRWFIAAGALLGAWFSKGDWLPGALIGATMGCAIWVVVLLSLNLIHHVARAVLWPVMGLARLLGPKSARVHRSGSYVSPSPTRYTAPAGYAVAAGAAAGHVAYQARDDILDAMNLLNAMNPLNPVMNQIPPTVPFMEVNTNGMPMVEHSMIDVTSHCFGDPTPIYEFAPTYDYTSSYDYSANNGCGGFDF